MSVLSDLKARRTRADVSLVVEVLAAINTQIEAGKLRNRGGDAVSNAISEGLLREDGQILYVVDDGIPVMLIEESIEL